MLGMGETEGEIYETIDDLFNAGCRILTIGQYLKPSPNHMDVVEYITPESFKKYGGKALAKGFVIVESAPLVRSSFHAEKHIMTL
jgi:lipoic acid synthetase